MTKHRAATRLPKPPLEPPRVHVNPGEKQLLTTGELAAALHVQVRTVYDRVKQGMPVAMFGRPNYYLWDDVVAWHVEKGLRQKAARTTQPAEEEQPC